MARIRKEHFYQGTPQAESYIQMQATDPEEEASRVLIELMHKMGVGNLQRALQKENFHLATEDNDDEAEQGFYQADEGSVCSAAGGLKKKNEQPEHLPMMVH